MCFVMRRHVYGAVRCGRSGAMQAGNRVAAARFVQTAFTVSRLRLQISVLMIHGAADVRLPCDIDQES